MKKNTKFKLPFIAFLFFILVYANQGISRLPGQCIYYLTREHWGLSATVIGLIGFIAAIAWCIKPIFGICTDIFPIKQYRTKYYLWINYILLTLTYLYIVCFGLNITSLIITGFLINTCLAFNDVACDTKMVIIERKYNLRGKLQSVQWIAFGVASLVVAFGGAKIATIFDVNIGYRVAYGIILIVPIMTLIYLKLFYKEKKETIKKTLKDLKVNLSCFKHKTFILPIIFIACLQFCPSFGLALQIKARETLGVSKMFLGYLGILGTGLSIIGYLLYYWKFHKFPIKKLLYFMIIFSVISNLFYLYIPNQWFLVIYGIAFGAFGGITFLTMLSLFARIIPKGGEGLLYALITSISNFCGNGSGFFGGIIYDHFGYSATVIVSSTLTLLCIFFIPHLKIKD